jgi:hypothetical protein
MSVDDEAEFDEDHNLSTTRMCMCMSFSIQGGERWYALISVRWCPSSLLIRLERIGASPLFSVVSSAPASDAVGPIALEGADTFG